MFMVSDCDDKFLLSSHVLETFLIGEVVECGCVNTGDGLHFTLLSRLQSLRREKM